MFLSLLTADAAASHGHEFSGHRPPSPSKRSPIPGISLPRSPLRALSAPSRPKATSAATRISPHPMDNGVINQVTKFEHIPTKNVEEASDLGNTDVSLDAADVSTPEADASSPPTSQSSRATSDKRARPRRTKTLFNLAHPPPRRHSIQRAKSVFTPHIVLQLFRVSSSTRPTPAFEAVQSAMFNPALSRSCAELHPKRLGVEDMVILEAEKYGNGNKPEKQDSSKWEGRRVLSVICACGPDIEVHMSGAVWKAKPLPNGRYDFVPVGTNSCDIPEVRWVKARQRLGSTRGRKSVQASNEPRMTFSTILADTRRHPVIASMTPANIEVLDEYALPTGSTDSEASSIYTGIDGRSEGRRLSSPAASTSPPISTDDGLREIICTTGIWVACQQGWSTSRTDSSSRKDSVTATNARPISMQIPPTTNAFNRLSCASFDESQIHEKKAPTKPSRGLGRLLSIFRRGKDG